MAGDERFERVAPIARPEDERTDFELIFRAQGLLPCEAGFRARTPDEVGADVIARYARADAERYERCWNEEMPHAMKIHVVGVGGVGMAALSQACIDAGHEVSGSDRQIDRGDAPPAVRALAAQGAAIFPQDGSGVTAATERVVVSTAIEDDNPDILAAKALGIKIVHRSAALADIVRGRRMIAVAGTSGKSTTTAILGHLLAAGGLDPWVVNGAEVVGWGGEGRVGSVRHGDGEWCVIEADESDRSFLRYMPSHAIVTNESADHFDIDETHALFAQFKRRVHGTVVEGVPADLGAEALPWATSLRFHGERFTIPLPGLHNAMNAWQALEMASTLGVADDVLRDALASFPGVRRRLERVGVTGSGAMVVDDYAHNPAKLSAAIAAVKGATDRPVCVVWRPHGFTPLRNMLEALADMFAASLAPDDRLVLLPVYDAGGTTDRSMNADALFHEIVARGFGGATFVKDWHLDPPHVADILGAASGCGAILVAGARDPDLPRLCGALAAPGA
jgi:UDP-N-acetylmuramate--alanine ligase